MLKPKLPNNSLPVICGVEITTDAEGRFNLNALHKASGGKDAKRPKAWMATKQAQELVEELRQNSAFGDNVIKVVKGGKAPGTFAHELLAVEYAGWISPSYRLQVNQTFLDYRTGKLQPAFDPTKALNDPVFLRNALLEYSEKVQVLEVENKDLSHKVESMENLFKEGMTPTQFCKMLNGVNVMMANRFLESRKWLYNESKRKTRWRVGNYARDKYLTEHQNTISNHGGEDFIKYIPVLLHKGAVRLYQLYIKGELPMKANWNGEYTHDKEQHKP
ncbi:KilA-N domain-containing protein [Rosenbergiella epipactidis]|uniref:KilA-N domain-containing protein n=1 Tax=Rosenbergiella epipactidis TaxID=1544694 RepID=UPI001F4EA7A1|nr:KilA-N domain-containing protein [Rosenbergiella epipactidis]